MFKSKFNPLRMVHHPLNTFFLGLLYSTLAVLITLFVFGGQGGIILVTLTLIPCVHLFYVVLHHEAEIEPEIQSEFRLLKEHGKVISFFIFLFIGFITSFSFWFVILPLETTENMFDLQLSTIDVINRNIDNTPNIEDLSGKAISQFGTFNSIFFSNIKVLLFAILFSIIYGVGAIFLLTWNASVIAAAIGDFIRSRIGILAESIGFNSLAKYFQTYSIGLVKYSLHALPEVAAYFTAALAGGILTFAIMKHAHFKGKFNDMIIDVSILLLISLFLLFIAALLEVFVTPMINI